jgi:hypothetical protein
MRYLLAIPSIHWQWILLKDQCISFLRKKTGREILKYIPDGCPGKINRETRQHP